ncbi:hypothetical protein HYU17_00595 [Candidatus Woesearchaeota archaeon]|nr:hypothetical protein [Candidatus Woesearchaeota archaeon]
MYQPYGNQGAYQGTQGNYPYSQYSAGRPRNIRALAVAAVVILAVAILVFAVFEFSKRSARPEIPALATEELVFTSPMDVEAQVDVRNLAGYDWAVMLAAPPDEGNAMRAVPYLMTLELETAIQQHELLNFSGKYVDGKTLQLLGSGKGLAGIMENLAVIEEAYYGLGLPSGAIHAERSRHLAKRLRVYGPPIGPINDFETRQFVQDHLGLAVDSYESWYVLLKARYDILVSELNETKDVKPVPVPRKSSPSGVSVDDALER